VKVVAVVKEDESSCARALVAVGDAQGGCDGHPGGTGAFVVLSQMPQFGTTEVA
jgi:hypothetical protein